MRQFKRLEILRRYRTRVYALQQVSTRSLPRIEDDG